MGKKITNKEITDLFIAKFERGLKFTPSDKRLMGIKLAALKKNYKKMIEEGIIVNKEQSIEEMIVDAIEYYSMMNKPFRSIASLGYGNVNEPINYWKKRRSLEESKQEEAAIQQQEESKPVETQQPVDYTKIIKSKKPKWMGDDGW